MTYPPPVDPYESSPHTAPLYDQPYVPPAPYPAPLAAPPRNGSRTTMIALLSAAIGVIVLVGGGVVFYLVGEHYSWGRGTPVRDTITISEPATLAGQPKIEADELSTLTSDLEKELEGYPGAANAFGAVYGSLPDREFFAALAAEVDVDDPQRMLDTAFQSFSGVNQLEGVTPASTGDLGGVAQCGSTVIDEEDVAICGWADEGSVGMILWFYETAVDVKGDFPDMRAEIETKD
ncbi:hypothetical protein ACGFJ7_14120 [Actinoplanes sp. NPDC048988]|uniref:hypothetical protein n=1 Tax=Actinoplanes sp. NPDC048988 TaxID=3363901 RepID=UPI0037135FB2